MHLLQCLCTVSCVPLSEAMPLSQEDAFTMLQLPIRTDELTLLCAGPAIAVRDYETKQPKATTDGEPIYSVQLILLAPDANAEVINVKTAGEPKGLVQGGVVRVFDLVAQPWTNRDRSGLAFRAGRIELGYVHLDPRGAELLFQVITEREEKSSIAVASNAPFSEWGKTFSDPRLVAAIVDRLTFNAIIVETGTASFRLAASQARKAATKKR